VQRSGAQAAGADGVSRFELGRPAAQRSVWVAVDVESGEFVVAAPDGYQIVRRPKPARLEVTDGALTLPAAPEYQIDHTYLYGARKTSQYSGTNHKILDNTIGFNTGLVSGASASSGKPAATTPSPWRELPTPRR
jgi:hypothetical protein